jgi:DNA mismatch repair protein MutL
MSSKIKKLPLHVISLIAAGEVAERPSGVIKELLENSLDAGATQIEILLEDAGMTKITVADNGSGMLPDELQLSVESHATSKITEAEDLDKIASYGFRGEALASIAKVSQLSIMSRHHSMDIPYHYQHTSRETLPSKHGMAVGTVIEIKELFARVPARKKFLNKPVTELRQTLDTIAKIALANPRVGFTVHHNAKQVLQFPSNQSLSNRFLQITDWELEPHLIPVQMDSDVIRVSGLISLPTHTKSHTQQQWLFVNQRPVSHSGIARTIKLAYKASIPPERHPLFTIHLELDPSLFDINRHPKKETIAFMDEQLVQKIVSQAIEKALEPVANEPGYLQKMQNQADSSEIHTLIDTKSELASNNDQKSEDLNSDASSASGSKTYTATHTPNTVSLKENTDLNQNTATNHRGHFPAEKFISSTLKNLINPWQNVSKKSNEPKIVIQIANTYLITEHNGSLIMVDQHAAHERILYETFRKMYNNEQHEQEPQTLQPPLTCNLTPQQVLLVEEHLQYLERIGFQGHFLGDNSFAVTTAPPLVPIEQARKILFDVLEDLAEGKPVSLVDGVAHRTIAYVACRSAIMAGDPLEEKERIELITTLFKSPNFQTCPHGRPTFIEYDQKQLEKLFGRR